MNFASLPFLVFLPVAVVGAWVLPGGRPRKLWLLAASGLFYGWLVPWWPLLLGASILLDWGCALGMGRWPAERRWLLGLSLLGNLGLLGAFKLAAPVAQALTGSGPPLWMALPVGISFYTFQSLSYSLDVYAGRLAPRRSLLDVATFVALFPQLVAGPIERARDLLPQVEGLRRPRPQEVADGLALLAWGAFQKVVVADSLGLYVDRVYSMEMGAPRLIWAATLAFAVQIFADFSGYTDLARGAGRLLGLRLSANFDRPFLADSPGAFWRRWHMTFTSWMHDHVYRPLRGPGGGLRSAAAGGLTLLLAGLWHGAQPRFLLWGAWFALVLLAWRLLSERLPRRMREHRWAPLATVPLTQALVLVGMLIFRMPDGRDSLALLGRLPWEADPGAAGQAARVLGVALAGGLLLGLGGWLERRWSRPGVLAAVGKGALVALLVLAVGVFARDTARDFVYFAF